MNSSFTEHILQRARERQRKIEELNTTENLLSNRRGDNVLLKNQTKSTSSLVKNTDNGSDRGTQDTLHETTPKTVTRISSLKEINPESNSNKRSSPITKISSNLPGSPQAQLKTLNIQKDNFNMEIKLISTDNVRVEVEIQDEASDKENDTEQNIEGKESELPGLREQAKYKLKKLGKLYAGGESADISSPIQNSEAYFHVESIDTDNISRETPNFKNKKGLSKLADLAQNIRQWEDDTSPTKKDKKLTVSGGTKSPTRTVTSKSTVTSYNKTNSPSMFSNGKSVTKQVEWDDGVIKALESQGFTRTESNSRLVYNCNNSPKKMSSSNQKQSKYNISSRTNVTNSQVSSQFNSDKKSSDVVSSVQIKTPIKSTLTSVVKQKRSVEGKISSGIESKKALFEQSSSGKSLKIMDSSTKDPSLLSLADRKALFERNKGTALLPKAAFAMAAPVANKDNKATIIKENIVSRFTKNVEEQQSKFGSGKLNQAEQKLENKHAVKKVDGANIANRIQAFNEKTSSEKTTTNNVMTTQQEIELLRNRFNKNKNINNDLEPIQEIVRTISEENFKIDTPKQEIEEKGVSERRRSRRKSDSPHVTSVLESVKHVKIPKPKEGFLYPPLSDIETATETEPEQEHAVSSSENSFDASYNNSEDGNTSFGREILQVVCKNQTPRKRSFAEESSDSNVSDILDSMDDYLDEAMAHAERSDCSNGPTPPKKSLNHSGLKQCTSFHYKSFTSESNFLSPMKTVTSPMKSPRKSTELPKYVIDGDNLLPLTHTVSFYRKQQTQVKTPSRQIIHQPSISEDEDDDDGNVDEASADLIAEKIKHLTEEVNKQQLIIAQTSQALNLCNSTLEFMGSIEQVEAEKLVLLASHRRQAALNEVQRLRVQGTLRPQDQHARNLPLEKGSLTISNIRLPLKKEYVRALAAAGGKGHHVICLVKSGEQVVSSQLVSTVATKSNNPDLDLVVSGKVKLENIYSDFAVTFEVYCLQAQEEILPHEVKYHINKKASNKLTPKKTKQDSRMVVPPKESPGGPQVVRSSSFAMMGYVVFSVQTINKTHFSLNNAPSMSPLEGRVDMKISCELAVSSEHKGFLTMFEDVSGFGAWHRRWCVLRGDTLSYWKYPDHEKEKAPIGSISLVSCTTEKVGPVNREICARLNTFLMETMKDSVPGEKKSLTLYHKSDKTVIRHLLSADTKEERIKWCEMFNKALIAIRMWGKK